MWDQKQRATEVVLWSLAVVAGPNLGVRVVVYKLLDGDSVSDHLQFSQ